MHILIIPSELYVTKKSPLAALFQYQQAHALKEKGFQVGVVSAGFVPFKNTLSKYPYPACEVDNGIVTYRNYKRAFMPGRIALPLFYRYFLGLYLKAFEKYQKAYGSPDIIHAHNCLYAGAVALKIKAKLNIPYVITEHSSSYFRGMISNRQANTTSEVFKNANAKTVVSTKLGSLLERLYGNAACPYYPIFNILDDRFENEDNILIKRKVDNEEFTFLSIGCIDSNKNHIDLINAFAHNFKGRSQVKLRVGGEGPLLGQLENKVKELGIKDQVIFTGLLRRNEVVGEIQNCDVFVLPSIFETFGVVLIEALALGKPVVATKCGGPADIVNQYNGLLVPTKDVDALADAMSYVYHNIDKYNAGLIRDDCLSRFGKDSFVKRLVSIYTSIYKKQREKK